MFDQKAINVYTKIGYKPTGVVKIKTNGSEYEFLRLVKSDKDS